MTKINFVILNETKDLYLLDKTDPSLTLRMTDLKHLQVLLCREYFYNIDNKTLRGIVYG